MKRSVVRSLCSDSSLTAAELEELFMLFKVGLAFNLLLCFNALQKMLWLPQNPEDLLFSINIENKEIRRKMSLV